MTAQSTKARLLWRRSGSKGIRAPRVGDRENDHHGRGAENRGLRVDRFPR